MSSLAERQNFLKEHLTYEVQMLRYTAGVLQHGAPQLSWNAHLASYAAHARNLYDFLVCEGGGTNFKANDYGAPKVAKGNMYHVFNKIDPHVMHLAKSRPTEAEKKITVDMVQEMKVWIEANFQDFLNSMDEVYRASWDDAAARPPAVPSTTSVTGPTGPARPVDAEHLTVVGLSARPV